MYVVLAPPAPLPLHAPSPPHPTICVVQSPAYLVCALIPSTCLKYHVFEPSIRNAVRSLRRITKSTVLRHLLASAIKPLAETIQVGQRASSQAGIYLGVWDGGGGAREMPSALHTHTHTHTHNAVEM